MASVVSDSVTPWTIVHQAPLSTGFSVAGILEWFAISYSRGSSPPRDGTHLSYISCIGRRVIYHWRHLGANLKILSDRDTAMVIQILLKDLQHLFPSKHAASLLKEINGLFSATKSQTPGSNPLPQHKNALIS